MPVTISDSSIRAAYKTLAKSFPAAGAKKATLDDLDKLLGRVADRAGLTMTSADKQLKAAVSVQEKLSIVREGMSDKEKADLTAILDGDLPLDADAKKFLEQLVGRTPTNPTTGPVDITSMKLVGGKVHLTGTAAPNVTVEALNLSLIPGDRLHDDDTFQLGTTNAKGELSGSTSLRAGDYLRIRTRDANGKTSDWMVVRADQLGKDDENALLAIQRIDLTDAGGGKVAMANNNNSRPLSEPFAKMQLENTRTKEKTVVTLDDTGRLPGIPKLDGKPGDTYKVSISDGRNNTAFKDVIGTLMVQGGGGGTGDGANIEDPKPHKDDRKPDGSARYDLKRYTGPLFKDGADYQDVVQGNLGDCYTPAAASALAFARPDMLPQIIRVATDADRATVNAQRAKKHLPALPANGKFYVVEFAKTPEGHAGKWLEAVDADLYSRSTGDPIYGTSSNSTDPDKMELWFPLFEKAWAQYNGDYNVIGNGGMSSDIFEAVLGRPGVDESFDKSTKDRCFAMMKDKLAKKLPCCLATKDDKGHEALFANTGIYGDHTYTVLDAYEKNGVKYLKLRNPWGESEPSGNGKNDGIFDIKLDDATKWYSDLWTVQ